MGKRRPIQHVIEEKAYLQFESSLPESWLHRRQDQDYGIDREVEIFENEKSTGIIFKVQIKGTKNPKFILNDSFISFSLSLDDVIYFCEELNVPMIFILCDVTNERTWWHAIQLDSELRMRIQKAQENNQASMTVKIDSKNEISSTQFSLFKKILETETYMSARSISSSPLNTLYSSFESVQNIDELIDGFDRGKSSARRVKLERLWESRDHTSIVSLINEILDDTSSLIEEKFSALYYSEIIELSKISMSRETPKVEYEFAVRRKEISHGGPLHLRSYAALTLQTAKLHQLAHNDLYLYMNDKVSQEPYNKPMTDQLWNLMLPSARILASISLVRKFRHCIRLIDFMINNKLLHIVPQSFVRVLMCIQPFLTRLWQEEMNEAAKYYEHTLENIAKDAVNIAIHLKNWKDVSLLFVQSILLGNVQDHDSIDKRREWAITIANDIEDNSIKEKTLFEIDHLVNSMQSWKKDISTKSMNLEDEEQIY